MMANKSNHSKVRGEGVKCGYAPVNDLKLYYEIHGHGTDEPLILLHGGVGGIEMFGPNLEPLAATRKVIAVDLQGHGHTADIDRPLRFESLGDDIAALFQFLGIERADIMGYSLGGGVGLQTTIRHPGLVRKLVVVSAPFRRRGFYSAVLQNMAQMGPEAARYMDQSPLFKLYPKVNWEVLFTKLGDLLRREYDWSREVAAIHSPVMLVYADADAIRTAHAVEFFSLLGGGQRDAGLDGSGRPAARLAIIPGATHYDILTTPVVASLVIPFLDAPMLTVGPASPSKKGEVVIKSSQRKANPQPAEGEVSLPTKLAQPARRALTGAGIQHLEQLTQLSEVEIKQLHGIGPNAIEQLRQALHAKGLSFKGR
jgi:pimeloyl-ACP methyl ester carboxylesterase